MAITERVGFRGPAGPAGTPGSPGVGVEQGSLTLASNVFSVQGAGSNGFTRVASKRWPGTSSLPTGTVTNFQSYLDVSTGMTAELRLYNVTTATVIATATGTSLTPLFSTQVVSMPAGEVDLEIQLRLTAGSPAPTDRVTCSGAELKLVW